MPVLTPQLDSPANMRKGDKTTYGEVINVKPKIKWVTVTFQGQAGPYEQDLLKDSVFEFSRLQETDEERAAKQLERTLLSLDYKENNARLALVAAQDKMVKEMTLRTRASHWTWMDVPMAEARVELWNAVAHVHRVHAERAVFEGGEGVRAISRVEAVRLVVEERTRQALSYYRATSRSTSVTSNLFDDIKIEALSDWRRELEWIIE